MPTTVTRKKSAKFDPIMSVVVRPAYIETQDISNWKNAVNSAKFGRYNQLLRLYENIMSDGLLSRAIDKRVEAVTNSDLCFLDKNNERVVQLDQLMDTIGFEKIIRAIVLAKIWGFSVIDVMSFDPLNVYDCNRRNLNISKHLILPDEGAEETGYDYQNDPYIIEIVNPDDPLGILYKAVPYVIYKRGGFGDWAQFVELFGMPFRVAKYSSYDQTTRNELIKTLKESGGAGWAVVPKEAEFTWVENKSNSTGQLHNTFIDRCDKEMLITILGQTMTTMEGSSRAQSDTHKEVEEGLNKSDRKFVCRVLNTSLVPLLEMAGYPVKDGFFSFPEAGETLSTADKLTNAMTLINAGLPVDDDYLYEVSGIPKPKGKTTTAKPKAPDPKNNDPANMSAEETGLLKSLARFFQGALGKRAVLKY